jgi:hypothetical protein
MSATCRKMFPSLSLNIQSENIILTFIQQGWDLNFGTWFMKNVFEQRKI